MKCNIVSLVLILADWSCERSKGLSDSKLSFFPPRPLLFYSLVSVLFQLRHPLPLCCRETGGLHPGQCVLTGATKHLIILHFLHCEVSLDKGASCQNVKCWLNSCMRSWALANSFNAGVFTYESACHHGLCALCACVHTCMCMCVLKWNCSWRMTVFFLYFPMLNDTLHFFFLFC